MVPEAIAAIIKDFEFDHVGIAVKSLSEGGQFYAALGLGEPSIEEVASESVRVAMYTLANAAKIELLEPTSEDSPIAKFLVKRGQGIHHICLRVKDLRAAMGSLQAANIRLINEGPKLGAHNCLIAFVHPASTGGVLLELSEPQSKGGL